MNGLTMVQPIAPSAINQPARQYRHAGPFQWFAPAGRRGRRYWWPAGGTAARIGHIYTTLHSFVRVAQLSQPGAECGVARAALAGLIPIIVAGWRCVTPAPQQFRPALHLTLLADWQLFSVKILCRVYFPVRKSPHSAWLAAGSSP